MQRGDETNKTVTKNATTFLWRLKAPFLWDGHSSSEHFRNLSSEQAPKVNV